MGVYILFGMQTACMMERNTIINRMIRCVAGFALLLAMAAPVAAGPFITIDSIDSTSRFPLIDLFITVRGVDNAPLPDIDESSIVLYEDGFRVNYLRIQPPQGMKEYIYFVYSVDSSKSVSPKGLAQLKKAAKDIVQHADADDMFAIYRFNDDVRMLNAFTSNRSELAKSLEGINRHGSKTKLYASIYDSIDLLSQVDTDRRAVIVFTDGIDEGSGVSADDVIQFAKEKSIPVYFVSLKSKRIQTIARIAKLTGGKLVCSSSTDDIAGMYAFIRGMLHTKRVVQYRSSIMPDNADHTVELRLKYDGIRDRAVSGFKAEKKMKYFEFSPLYQILVAAVLIVLLGLSAACCVVLIRRSRAVAAAKMPPVPEIAPAVQNLTSEYIRAIRRDEREKKQHARLITPQDPEYVYAKAWLVQKDGPEAGRKFPIYWEELFMGRDEENAIVVKDDAVSQKHAKIKDIRGACYLFDLASDNGTYLNGKKLLRPKPLYDWDEIKIGRTLFIFRGSKIA